MVLKKIAEAFSGSSIQRCPQCDHPIAYESINIKEGVACCDPCRKLFRLSELNWSHRSREEVLAKTPLGCSKVEWGQSLTLTASARSIPTFIGLSFACLFCNGILSVFLSIAIAGLWANLVGPIPGWFPMPGGVRQGRPIMNDAPMNLGTTLFLCLFLIPFVTVGTGLVLGAMFSLLGRVKVVIDQVESYVSTGIGFLSWKNRFDPMGIDSVKFSNSSGDGESAPKSSIQLVGEDTIEFGSTLPSHRRQWLAACLQEIFSPNDISRDSRPVWLEPNNRR
jgi:hypothetical protein